jgi:diguanylate cyclase (GGDEF)-like protein
LKQINDLFGHQQGNVALVEAADILRTCFRVSDIQARLGGDEFALFSNEMDEEKIAARIQEKFDARNAATDRPFRLSFSAGVVCCRPGDNTDIEHLLGRADALMYQLKQKKANSRYSAGPGI